MKTEKSERIKSETVVQQVFRDQAVTISKSGSEVIFKCANTENAEALFDWLSDLSLKIDGDPIGWKIVAIGDDGSVLCEHPTGRCVRYWFTTKSS